MSFPHSSFDRAFGLYRSKALADTDSNDSARRYLGDHSHPALRILSEQEISVIISDQGMPGFTGCQSSSTGKDISQPAGHQPMLTGLQHPDSNLESRLVPREETHLDPRFAVPQQLHHLSRLIGPGAEISCPAAQQTRNPEHRLRALRAGRDARRQLHLA